MNKLKPKLPSPAMVVALIALVMASTGTAAAITVANSDRVDGIHAVPAGASLARTAGKLVATNKDGSHRGQIQPKYLDLSNTVTGHGFVQVFGGNIQVVDNATLAAQVLVNVPFFGTLSVACRDENPAAGREDPQSTVTFTNTSGNTLALARTGSGVTTSIRDVQNGTTDSFTLSSAHTYEYNIQSPRGVNVLIHGVVNQLGRNTAAASCNEYGQALRVG
jgi:YD repeat-containing protein